MPSNSAESNLNTAIVPSEDAAYSVRPSNDLGTIFIMILCVRMGWSTNQLRSIICLSKTSLATIKGLAHFVCQIDTDLSPAPNATTEHMLDVATGEDGFRRKMCGL